MKTITILLLSFLLAFCSKPEEIEPIKIIEIGSWNMQEQELKKIDHHFDLQKIACIKVTILEDYGAKHEFEIRDGEIAGEVLSIGSDFILLRRFSNSWYNSDLFNNPEINRGFIIIFFN